MDLLALAVPFFLLALLFELAVDRWRGTGFFRANDAVNSLSAGTLSTTFDYFTKFLSVYIFGLALQNFAIFEIELAWFDTSPRGLLLWAFAVLAWDFCYYWSHRCGHEISVLWASHAVHHQSEDYNLSTALRQSSTGFLFNWIFYLPLFVIGLPLEVVATANAIDLIYQFWVHTQHIGKLGWLDRIVVTPSNHRVHHAQNETYIDKNYGGILIVWDRLFGTYQEELDDVPVVYGVRKPLATWNPFRSIAQVYAYLWFDAIRTKRWRDKLGIWFRRTGWRPADVAERHPTRSTDLRAFEKFDPRVPKGVRRYVLVQFVVAALAVLMIAALYAEQGARAVLLPCIALWAALYAFGLLNEGRSYARRVEFLRLLLLTPLAVAGVAFQGTVSLTTSALVSVTAAYCVGSVALLIFLGRRKSELVVDGQSGQTV